jgi:hypothetical protein
MLDRKTMMLTYVHISVGRIRVLIGERPQENSFNETENGGVGPNAES